MKKLILLLILISFTSCAGRTPDNHTAEKIIQKHFKKYSKKYSASEFGKASVDKIEITQIQENQKNVAQARANLTLNNGENISILMGFIYKFPLGWRSQGWEKLNTNSPASPNKSSK